MKSFFEKSKKHEMQQAFELCQQFDIELKQIEPIPGTTGDFTVSHGVSPQFPVGSIVEFKYDFYSMKSGNVFLEFEQTRDGWFTSKASGVKLAIDNGNIVIITIPCEIAGKTTKNFILRTHKEYNALVQNSHRVNTTRRNSNGNSNGVFSRGHLVKVAFLENLENF